MRILINPENNDSFSHEGSMKLENQSIQIYICINLRSYFFKKLWMCMNSYKKLTKKNAEVLSLFLEEKGNKYRHSIGGMTKLYNVLDCSVHI
jgi:hypothetical protein